ncbi:MAG: methyltransferase domain-containing protein [Clostridiales bacterium]|nr:methyltransferase domain-containing protein [Clostridiales bacterium]
MAEISLSEYEVVEDMGIANLKIIQDKRLYRFTSDSVLLSRFAAVKKGEKIADFCAGSGIVAFHTHALHIDKPPAQYTLFEMQAPLCNLAKKTIEYNGFTNFAVVNCRLQDIPKEYAERFSLILCNPPYERAGTGFDNADYEKAVCRKEITLTLAEIAKAAAKSLKYGGRLCMVHRADRLAELCYVLKGVGIEVKKLQFVAGRDGTKPYLVLLEGVKGGKPATKILPTIVN